MDVITTHLCLHCTSICVPSAVLCFKPRRPSTHRTSHKISIRKTKHNRPKYRPHNETMMFLKQGLLTALKFVSATTSSLTSNAHACLRRLRGGCIQYVDNDSGDSMYKSAIYTNHQDGETVCVESPEMIAIFPPVLQAQVSPGNFVTFMSPTSELPFFCSTRFGLAGTLAYTISGFDVYTN